MEQYIPIVNEVLQYLCLGRPEEQRENVGDANAPFFSHRCSVVIEHVAFEGEAKAKTKKEAKKGAYKIVVQQLFPRHFQDGLSDSQITNAIGRDFRAAKDSKSVPQLLQDGLQARRRANNGADRRPQTAMAVPATVASAPIVKAEQVPMRLAPVAARVAPGRTAARNMARPVARNGTAAGPEMQTAFARMEALGRTGVAVKRSPVALLCAAIVRAMGSAWTPDMRVTEKNKNRYVFGEENRCYVELERTTKITASLRNREGPQNKSDGTVGMRLFDDFLMGRLAEYGSHWTLTMRDLRGRKIMGYRAQALEQPFITETTAQYGEDSSEDPIIFELENKNPGRSVLLLNNIWEKLIEAAFKLSMPTKMLGECITPWWRSRPTAQNGTVKENWALETVRNASMPQLPASVLSLSKLSEAKKNELLMVIPKFGSSPGTLVYRGIKLEEDNDLLRSCSFEANELELKTVCSKHESIVEWQGLVNQICRTLDFLLAFGDAEDLANFFSIIKENVKALSLDSIAGAQQMSASMRRHMVIQAAFGPLWTTDGIWERFLACMHMHSSVAWVCNAGSVPFCGLADETAVWYLVRACAELGVNPRAFEPTKVPWPIYLLLSEKSAVRRFPRTVDDVVRRSLVQSSTSFDEVKDMRTRKALTRLAVEIRAFAQSLMRDHVIPVGEVVLHRMRRPGPLAYCYIDGKHHFRLGDVVFCSTLVSLPVENPLSLTTKLAAEVTAGSMEDDGGPKLPAAKMDRPSKSSVCLAAWQKFLVGAATLAQGNLRIEAHGQSEFHLVLQDKEIVARFLLVQREQQIFVGLRGCPWEDGSKSFFARGLLDIIASGTAGVWLYRQARRGSARISDELDVEEITVENMALAFKRAERRQLRHPMKPEDDLEEEDELLLQDQEEEDDPAGKQVAQLMLCDERARCSHVFFCKHSAGFHEFEAYLKEERSCVFDKDGVKRDCAVIGSRRGGSEFAFLLGPKYRGMVFYKGICVARNDFPQCGWNFSSRGKELRPSTVAEDFSVLDGKSLDHAWRDILEDPEVLLRLFERLSTEFHDAEASEEHVMSTDFGKNIRGFHSWRRTHALLRCSEGVFNSLERVPVRNSVEQRILSSCANPPVTWLVSPFVHMLASFHGRSMFSYLCKKLVHSQVVDATEALSEEELTNLERSMTSLGLKEDGESLTFHAIDREPLLYAKVGKVHHFARRFNGMDLLTQMLLSVPEEREFHILSILMDLTVVPGRRDYNQPFWTPFDAVCFIKHLSAPARDIRSSLDAQNPRKRRQQWP